MSRGVNLYPSNWQVLGTVANGVPQYRLTVRFDWTDDAGVDRTFGPVAITFPDFITSLTAPERAFMADGLRDLIVSIARYRAGIDNN